MKVESKNQEVNSGMRISDERRIQSQELKKKRESDREWPVTVAANKNNLVNTKKC